MSSVTAMVHDVAFATLVDGRGTKFLWESARYHLPFRKILLHPGLSRNQLRPASNLVGSSSFSSRLTWRTLVAGALMSHSILLHYFTMSDSVPQPLLTVVTTTHQSVQRQCISGMAPGLHARPPPLFSGLIQALLSNPSQALNCLSTTSEAGVQQNPDVRHLRALVKHYLRPGRLQAQCAAHRLQLPAGFSASGTSHRRPQIASQCISPRTDLTQQSFDLFVGSNLIKGNIDC